MRGRGLRVTIGAALALGLGVSACGGGATSSGAGARPVVGGHRAPAPSTAPPGAPVSIATLRLAASHTQAAPSYRFASTMSLPLAGKQLSIDASGATAGTGKRLQVEVHLAGFGAFDERLVDDVLYVDLAGVPLAASQLPDNRHWLSVPLSELQSKTGIDVEQLFAQAQQSSPTQGLQYLQGLSGDVERIGDDTVRDAHAVHYRASIDYASLAGKLGGSSEAAQQRLVGLGTQPADVWLDDQGRVVKLHVTIDAGAPGASPAGNVEVTTEMSGFGEPVDVQAPPADETMTLDDLEALTPHAGATFHDAGDKLTPPDGA